MYRSKSTTPKSKPQPKKKSDPMPNRGVTKEMLAKLLEHSKQHKGGMRSAHMRAMMKEVKAGKSFAQAHKVAKALDMKKKNGSKK